MMEEPVLSIRDLKKNYGDIHAVDGLNLDVKKGEIYGLLGPNGAGKSTTMKCILGLLDIHQGSISVLGKDPVKEPEAVRAVIGYVPEEPLIYKSLTPAELFDFIASIRQIDPVTATRRVQELMISLDAVQYYHSAIITLSRGNQQKIQIIAALMHEPGLLVLDEPMANLDAKSCRIVKELLQMHIEHGGSVLLSTHVMEQASELCTRIGIIHKGKIVAEGTLDELRGIAHQAGANLASIFLKFTEQDKAVKQIVEHLRANNEKKGM
nr:ABC transporter ATP-binding protein [Candidatus Sigynarchaeota archaeon]